MVKIIRNTVLLFSVLLFIFFAKVNDSEAVVIPVGSETIDSNYYVSTYWEDLPIYTYNAPDGCNIKEFHITVSTVDRESADIDYMYVYANGIYIGQIGDCSDDNIGTVVYFPRTFNYSCISPVTSIQIIANTGRGNYFRFSGSITLSADIADQLTVTQAKDAADAAYWQAAWASGVVTNGVDGNGKSLSATYDLAYSANTNASVAKTSADGAKTSADAAKTQAITAVNELQNTTYGLSKIKTDTASAVTQATSANTQATSANTQATTAASKATTAVNELQGTTYGLNKIKTDTASAVTQATAANTNASNAITAANNAKASADTASTRTQTAINELQSTTYGLNKIKTDTASAVTQATSANTNASNAATRSLNNYNILNDSTKGLTKTYDIANNANTNASTAAVRVWDATENKSAATIAKEARDKANTAVTQTLFNGKSAAEWAAIAATNTGDNLAPDLECSWQGGATITNASRQATLMVSVSDNISAPANITRAYSLDGTTYTIFTGNTVTITFPMSPKYRTVYVKATDEAGKETVKTLNIFVQ
ncbi:autotransporter outer membrane beta-barrel domain-containing protein [Desulfotomaculum defluvii]